MTATPAPHHPRPQRLISDIHLGFTRVPGRTGARFSASGADGQLFLVGDIVDIWSMRRSFYWHQMHNDVCAPSSAKPKHGTRVIYVPGKSRRAAARALRQQLGNLEIHREYVASTLRGLELLVMHGDEFDGAVKCRPLARRPRIGPVRRDRWAPIAR